MSRYICIHGHFYQPPRENAWLETIELQPSALPDHDWNERITTECYRPNAAARILNEQGRILEFINVYEHISFNFGPTLLSWMQEHAPDVHDAIVKADHRSRERYSGHGSAIAQAYNHLIMPLANPRDRRTQVTWGIRDFEYRFGRKPEGMWLPETAVDMDTLEALAEQDIAFTILAPYQLAPDTGEEVDEDNHDLPIDPRQPYRIDLPSGRSIAVFAYDGDLAQAVAFERLLNSGDAFAQRLIGAFPNGETNLPPLVHIATDGETYGHHHRYGEMALAFALRTIDERDDIHLTNYGEYLERFPPIQKARLVERTAWSCAHGIERWRSDCGCSSGAHPKWNQRWRVPLREALNALRDEAAKLFHTQGSHLFNDPWKARDAFIDVVLDRSDKSIERFLRTHARPGLTLSQLNMALAHMEIQRHAMLMFTSCGWFFDDISGIETRQILQYASRVIELCRQVGGANLAERFLNRLGNARSNVKDMGTGRKICKRMIETGQRSLPELIARRALTDLMQVDEAGMQGLYGHDLNVRHHEHHTCPEGAIHHATARVTSRATRMMHTVEYVGFALGDEIGCLCRELGDPDSPTDESLITFVRDLQERGVEAILEPLPRFQPLLKRLPELSAEIQWWYLNERWSQLIDAIHDERPIDEGEFERLHFLALGLGVPTPPALLHRIHTHANLDVRAALRASPPELQHLSERLVHLNSLLVPIDHQLLHEDGATFVSTMIERLHNGAMDASELRLLAFIGRDLVPMLPCTELYTLREACLLRLSRTTTGSPCPEREAIEHLFEALGLHLPDDTSG